MIAGYLLTPACAIAHFGGIWDVGCPVEEDKGPDPERIALERENQDIQRRIDVLEAQLAVTRCEGEHEGALREGSLLPEDRTRDRSVPVPPADDARRTDDLGEEGDLPRPSVPEEEDMPDEEAEVAPPPEPPVETPPEEEPEAPRDLADLEGCWSLESELEFRLGDGDTQPFPEWNVCFEEGSDGAGTQVMRSDDGMLCEGPIQGAFNADGALVMTEEGDLVCNDGTEIFQRVTTCSVDDRGLAVCESVQPRTGGRGSFNLKRN